MTVWEGPDITARNWDILSKVGKEKGFGRGEKRFGTG